jgi:DNA repair exonuclease SbcCD ATPase subunit
MVEQQWHNRHARRLEEQAKLLQELRDEQERLRDEQEKIKDNEQRIGEKNNMSGAAQGGSVGPGPPQSVLAAFDDVSTTFAAARTALQQMAHAQEQYKREAEWSAEEETCSGGSNERGAEISEPPSTLQGAEEETCSGGSNELGAENSEPPITLQGFADALASLTAQLQRIADERGAKNSEPPTKEDK